MLRSAFKRLQPLRYMFSSNHHSENLGKSEGKVFFESVSAIVKGDLHSIYIVEYKPNLT
jgi:hypothetical protein